MKTISEKVATITNVAVGVLTKKNTQINIVYLEGAPVIEGRFDKSGQPVIAGIVLTDYQLEGMCLKAGFDPSQAGNLLIGAELVGAFEFQLAGSTYVANEFSKEVIAGNVKVGAELEREEDGYRVDNVLKFVLPSSVSADLSAASYDRSKERHKLAQMRRASMKVSTLGKTTETAPANTGKKALDKKAAK